MWSPMLAASVMVIMLYAVAQSRPSGIYQPPDHLFGIVRAEGNNSFEFQNIKTHELSQWQFCQDFYPNFKMGFVISRLVVTTGRTETGEVCPAVENESDYTIVRGEDRNKNWSWNYLYEPVTKYDGEKRPVLAKNCSNYDTFTTCTGDEAQFTQEVAAGKIK